VAAAEARDAILAALPDDEAAVAEQEVFAAAGVSRTTGRRVIAELLAAGVLAQRGTGRRNDPRRFWRLARPE